MDTDEELYRRTRAGEMDAFDALYARYEVPLFGFLLAQLKNRQDAEDLFHQAFMNALTSREPELGVGGFRPWIYRIARNLALNRMRSQRRADHAIAALPEIDVAKSPHDELERERRTHALALAVARLPPSLSDVYQLRASGLSYKDIAAVLEIPLGTLKSRMHELVTHLRKELTSWTAR